MSTFSLLLKGSSLRTLESVVSIIAGLITLPLMMRYLGVELYGIWVLIGSFTALLYIFDLGFASAVNRHVAGAIAAKDDYRVNQIVNNALVIYGALALLIIACVSLVAVFYQPDLHGVLSQRDFAAILWLFGAALAIEFPVKAFNGIATGYLRYDLLSAYRITFRIVSTVCLVALLMAGYELVAIALLNAVMGVLSAVAYVCVARYLFSPMALGRRFIDKQIMGEIYRYSFWSFWIDINQLLKNRIDIFFIGAYLSLGAVSLYYVAVRLVDYVTELLQKMLGIVTPVLTRHDALGKDDAFRDDLLLFTRINIYIGVLVFTGWVVFGELIIWLWMGEEFDYKATYDVLLILLLGRLAGIMVTAFTSSIYAKAAHKSLVTVTFFEAITSAILLASLVGLERAGVIASIELIWVAVAITIPLLIGRLLLIPLVSLRLMPTINRRAFLITAFRPLVLWVLAIAWWVAIRIYGTNIENFVSNALFYFALLVSVFLVAAWLWIDLQPRERELIGRMRKSLMQKVTGNSKRHDKRG